MRIAIIYTTISGNTAQLATMIAEELQAQQHIVHYFQIGETDHIMDYDLVLFGCYTWGDGELPAVMRDELRRILKMEAIKLKQVALFGTGDSAFVTYCRALDEMRYHFQSYNIPVIGSSLRIEQSPQSLRQPEKIIQWVNGLLTEIGANQ